MVTLYYREGQSARQVADLLGLREDAVKQRLSRARQRLRASLLDEVGETLRVTAPGAAFTAGVMALTVAAPSTAAAAGIGVSASGVFGTSVLAKVAMALGGAGAGIAGGVAGVLFGTSRLRRQARDERERAALVRFTWVTVTTVVIAGLSIPLGWLATQSPWAPVASYFGLLAALGGALRRVAAADRRASSRGGVARGSVGGRAPPPRPLAVRARLRRRRGEWRARPARRARRDLALRATPIP